STLVAPGPIPNAFNGSASCMQPIHAPLGSGLGGSFSCKVAANAPNHAAGGGAPRAAHHSADYGTTFGPAVCATPPASHAGGVCRVAHLALILRDLASTELALNLDGVGGPEAAVNCRANDDQASHRGTRESGVSRHSRGIVSRVCSPCSII